MNTLKSDNVKKHTQTHKPTKKFKKANRISERMKRRKINISLSIWVFFPTHFGYALSHVTLGKK